VTRAVVTGVAGFVGSHVARRLVATGRRVTGVDLVPAAAAHRLSDLLDTDLFDYAAADLGQGLDQVLPGATELWHLAANTDIPRSGWDTEVDIRSSVLATRDVLEGMRRHQVQAIVFPSTGAVYGTAHPPPYREDLGPLLPSSLYAAGKIAAEALISAYCQLFGIQAHIFRLGNLVGGQMQRGIVLDFLRKLTQNPRALEVLGDGRQRKSYVLVDDVVEAMRWISARAQPTPCTVYNIASTGSLTVLEVAAAVADALEIDQPELTVRTSELSWPGDQPVVELDITRALGTGWAPRHSPRDAVLLAARRLLAENAVGRPA
jgi:UDP-glucose 4-epimerase